MKVFVKPSAPAKPVPLKTNKINTPEYLSNDILEEEFIKTFLPVYRLQQLLGSCRVDARNRFISTPTWLQKIYTIVVVLVMVSGIAFMIKTFYPRVEDATVYGLIVTSVLVHLLSYICNIVHVRFMNEYKNVNFHLKMQGIDRLMKIEKSKQIYTMVKGINYASVIFFFCIYLAVFIVAVYYDDLEFLAFISVACNQFTYIVELMTCSNLVIYFLIRLSFINGILNNHLKTNKAEANESTQKIKVETKKPMIKKFIRKLATDTHNFVTSDTSVYLRKLFHCFESFQELYRFQLFIFSLKLVFMSLIVFELLLFSIQKNKIYQMEIISLIIFTAIDILVGIILGYRYEYFYGEVKETKRLAIGIMAIHQTGPLREKARTMLKMIEETPPRFSIYDMWEMNAGLLLTIFSLVTSLIVTLLQFAFL